MDGGIFTAAISAVAGFLLAALGYAGFWMARGEKQGQNEADARHALQMVAENAEQIKLNIKAIDEHRHDMLEAGDRIRQEFGQTVEAIRVKVHGFETWARDEFMRKQSFESVISRLESAQNRRDEALDRRLARIEEKIDDAAKRDG